ncbi:CynX/NimT family MFS transporter [Mycolicibacterium goodii]|uniref:CynX/NimT family MFS transporter n=1 Tax=Mycolicibacterium goodii TaxID=134601 RepID=UPI0009F88557
MTYETASPTVDTPRRAPTRVTLVLTAVGIILVAANLRPAVVAVAPLVDSIRLSTHWSSAMIGALTTLPLLMFGLAAPLGPYLAAKIGIERTIFAALITMIVGIALRALPNVGALFVGSALIGVGVGICNAMLPALIKRDFARRSGLMTGLYSMTLSGGAAVASAIVVPIHHAVGGQWRIALAIWAIPTLVALIVWIPQLRAVHRMHPTAHKGNSLLRNPIAWAITIFMGTQSTVFFASAAWLPEILIERGMTAAAAGAVLAVCQIAGLISSLIAPMIAVRFEDQRVFTCITIGICAAGFIGFLSTHQWPVLWTVCIMVGPGSCLALALLFMVLRSTSTEQTGQVSGMAQSGGYVLAAAGPVALGLLHDLTGSWTIALGALGLVLIPQTLAGLVAARNVTMSTPDHTN